jgi:hypothetical protein
VPLRPVNWQRGSPLNSRTFSASSTMSLVTAHFVASLTFVTRTV